MRIYSFSTKFCSGRIVYCSIYTIFEIHLTYEKNPIPGVDLVAKADVDWIKNIKKYNDYYYSFDALPNNTEDTREGHIDLTYSTVHKRLTFIQVPND